jgi:hypothetical protein
MVSYYIAMTIGFVFGYFSACLMMMAKRNTKVDIDYECHSFNNKGK